MSPAEVVYKSNDEGKDLSKKVSLDGVIKSADIYKNFFQISKVFLEQ